MFKFNFMSLTVVANPNGRCTQTQTSVSLYFSSPLNPHNCTLHARSFKVKTHDEEVRTPAQNEPQP